MASHLSGELQGPLRYIGRHVDQRQQLDENLLVLWRQDPPDGAGEVGCSTRQDDSDIAGTVPAISITGHIGRTELASSHTQGADQVPASAVVGLSVSLMPAHKAPSACPAGCPLPWWLGDVPLLVASHSTLRSEISVPAFLRGPQTRCQCHRQAWGSWDLHSCGLPFIPGLDAEEKGALWLFVPTLLL